MKEERFGLFDRGQSQKAIGEIIRAVEKFSETATGALIVLKRDTGLLEYIETGTLIDSMVSAAALRPSSFLTPLYTMGP